MQTSLILPCGGSDSKGMGKAEGGVELMGRVPGLEKPGERVAQSKIQWHQPPSTAREDPESRQEVLYNQHFLRK